MSRPSQNVQLALLHLARSGRCQSPGQRPRKQHTSASVTPRLGSPRSSPELSSGRPPRVLRASSRLASPPLTMPPLLPPETIRHIIQLSLPPVLYSAFEERYALLLSYSLVNSTWRQIAKEELFRDLWVANKAVGDRILQGMHGEEAVLMQRTRTVRFGGTQCQWSDFSGDAALVKRVLLLCEGVEQVMLFELTLSVTDLAGFQGEPYVERSSDVGVRAHDAYPKGLNALHLGCVELTAAGGSEQTLLRPPSLTHLTHLTLVDCNLHGPDFDPWSTLLCPTTLPQLRHLILWPRVQGIDLWHDRLIPAALSTIAPQLKSFAMRGDFSCSRLANWPEFTQLRRLCILGASNYWVVSTALRALPSSLDTLRITLASPISTGNVSGILKTPIEAFKLNEVSVRSIKTVRIDGLDSKVVDGEVRERMEVLRGLVEDRGVHLVRTGHYIGCDLDWDACLDPWWVEVFSLDFAVFALTIVSLQGTPEIVVVHLPTLAAGPATDCEPAP
jgi:hypothetical protein